MTKPIHQDLFGAEANDTLWVSASGPFGPVLGEYPRAGSGPVSALRPPIKVSCMGRLARCN